MDTLIIQARYIQGPGSSQLGETYPLHGKSTVIIKVVDAYPAMRIKEFEDAKAELIMTILMESAHSEINHPEVLDACGAEVVGCVRGGKIF